MNAPTTTARAPRQTQPETQPKRRRNTQPETRRKTQYHGVVDDDGARPPSSKKHFSMIRSFHLADLFTIANGFCGVAAIFHAMRAMRSDAPRSLYLGAALVGAALVFDFLDGHIARWRHKASALGRELDSLADVISFGVAPACIAYAVGMDGALDQAILLYFAGCGVSRLARYNVSAAAAVTGPTDKVKFYEGTPITFSIVPLAIVLGLASQGPLSSLRVAGLELHYATLLFLVSGSLMISKTLRIPKL